MRCDHITDGKRGTTCGATMELVAETRNQLVFRCPRENILVRVSRSAVEEPETEAPEPEAQTTEPVTEEEEYA